MRRSESEPPQPRVCSTSEMLGQDPTVNSRVKAVLEKNQQASSAEIAAELELDEWVVWRSVKRMLSQPYLRSI